MKLEYKKQNLLYEFNKGEVTSVTLENKNIFYEFVSELKNQAEAKVGGFDLYDNNVVVAINKIVDLVVSPFDINFSNKNLIKKLYSDVVAVSEENDYDSKIAEVYSLILDILEKINSELTYEIDYDIDKNPLDLFKFMDISVKPSEGKFNEQLIDYIRIENELLGKNVFILVNCLSYIEYGELKYLKECAKYRDIAILLIESKQSEERQIDKEYILDADFCEI